MMFAGCFFLRITELVEYNRSPPNGGEHYRVLSYDILATLSPFLCNLPKTVMTCLQLDCRQLLHLNFFRFFGTMIVILEKMITETAIFFLLLLVIAAGFLQSFTAYVDLLCDVTKRSLESSNGHVVVLGKILNSMTQALLQSPDFDFYGNLRPPFGLILFYVYTSVVTICMCVILSV
jgi:hypothetical protein